MSFKGASTEFAIVLMMSPRRVDPHFTLPVTIKEICQEWQTKRGALFQPVSVPRKVERRTIKEGDTMKLFGSCSGFADRSNANWPAILPNSAVPWSIELSGTRK